MSRAERWVAEAAADLADLAAVYLVGFTRSQGFTDGNKRTGLACAVVFISLDGAPLHGDGAALSGQPTRVATNQAGDTDVAAHLRCVSAT